MFPALKLKVSGLEPNVNYVIMVDIVPVDSYRYKYQDSRWVVAGKADHPVTGRQVHVHPDSPATGQHWMSRTLSFQKLKLTNNVVDKQGHVSARSSFLFIACQQHSMHADRDVVMAFRSVCQSVRPSVCPSVHPMPVLLWTYRQTFWCASIRASF